MPDNSPAVTKRQKEDPLRKEDLEEFVLAGIKSDEELKWFSRPDFIAIWRNEFSAALTKIFLIIAAVLGLFSVITLVFFKISTILVIAFAVSLGAIIFRLGWIYYLSRRLTYVITSSRLLFLLEAGRPIEYKSYLLSMIKKTVRVDHPGGSSDLLLPEQSDALYGVSNGELAEQLLSKIND
ncbi:hypothetical protein [Kiloniella sp.]|uniref:hypothetical protein n=1 Tax=Kiloniella sp. TaxID=1938587 RepID=UPI003B02B51B